MGPTRPLATKNVQLMTECEVLQFHHRPATEPAGENGDDETHVFKHAGNTMAVNPKTLDFSLRLEFLVGTRQRMESGQRDFSRIDEDRPRCREIQNIV
jgi:hypothetical protein